jgi:hypothetical protein
MRRIVLLWIALLAFMIACVSYHQNKSAETKSLSMESNQVQSVDRLVFREGKESKESAGVGQSDTILRLTVDLLAQSETMRLYIEDDELETLLADINGFGFEFVPSISLNGDENALSKILFLTSGRFAPTNDDNNVIFFVFLDGELVRSPFQASNSRNVHERLRQLSGYTD